VDWLRRILGVLFGGRSDDRDDDRRPDGVSMVGGARDDSTPLNSSGSPDDRDEGDHDDDGGIDDGGSDDGGSDD